MIDSVQVTLLLIPSIAVTLMFFIYGYNYYYLLIANRRYSVPKPDMLPPERPSVAIHLPIYNERYVVRRLLESCSKIAENYGKERVRIMILDDSSDDTTKELEEASKQYVSQGFRMEVLHREKRIGFKAGALQEALQRTNEEYIAVFDSDFMPGKDFLDETIPHLVSDENLGIVQCRWSYTNREYNFITKAVAIGMSAHFLVEQPGRYASGCLLNFNGSGGVIRSKALRAGGGWQPDTLAEDLDVSYRIQLNGYRIFYSRDHPVLSEITPTITSFKRQQARWACGSLQTAKKILPLLKQSKLDLKQKVEAFVHLTYYLVHPLLFASFLLAVVAGILNINTIGFKVTYDPVSGQSASAAIAQMVQTAISMAVSQPLLVLAVFMLTVCFAGVWIVYVVTLRIERSSLIKNLPSLLILGFIGFGISISNTIQSAKALLTTRVGSFERTPKYALQRSAGEWRDKKYQVPLNRTFYLEVAAAAIGLITIVKSIHDMNVGLILILSFYVISYGLVAVLTLTHSGEDK